MSTLQNVRARLEDYRKKKRESVSGLSETISSVPTVQEDAAIPQDNVKNDQNAPLGKVTKKTVLEDSDDVNPKLYWLTLFLKVAVWLLLWAFFISVEFGLVYFMCSCLVLIVLSMRGGKKRPKGTLSAYSVFNKNFEVIDGTFTAEQFEKELRHGPASVR